jgi:hypothetical protein
MCRLIALTFVSFLIILEFQSLTVNFPQFLVIFHVWISGIEAGSFNRFSGSGNEGNIYRQSFDSKLSFDAVQGKYNAEEDKWKYKPDNRGKYVHVHIPALPYDGE